MSMYINLFLGIDEVQIIEIRKYYISPFSFLMTSGRSGSNTLAKPTRKGAIFESTSQIPNQWSVIAYFDDTYNTSPTDNEPTKKPNKAPPTLLNVFRKGIIESKLKALSIK